MEKKSSQEALTTIENLIGNYHPLFKQHSDSRVAEFFEQLTSVINTSNVLILKTIQELLPLHFFVEDYQRGYKWLPQQVEELLNDIHEFEPDSDNFYCLQPVVVKYHGAYQTGGESRWELIDGQQRMTTTYMILSYLGKAHYSIDYKTRVSSSDFLQHYLDKTLASKDWDDFLDQQRDGVSMTSVDLDNVDNYHFYSAYKTIDKWFSDEKRFPESVSKDEWLQKLLHRTKVIWYAAQDGGVSVEKQQSIDIFMRINSGKISLTNAELIKALFLHHVADHSNKELAQLQQSEMAQQWDAIEHGLQDEEFWAFLHNSSRNKKLATRIDLLFDLISDKPQITSKAGAASQDTLFAFNHFSNLIKKSSNERDQVLASWHLIRLGYYRLLEWYHNDELYHLTGLLISRKIRSIKQLWMLAENQPKSTYIAKLKEIIADTLRGYFRSGDKKILYFFHLQYNPKDRQKIITVLMLLNIDVHRHNQTRLSFKAYRDTEWDIEHIHAQNSKPLDDQKQADAWLSDQKTLLDSDDIPKADVEKLIEQLEAWDQERLEDFEKSKVRHKAYLLALAEVVGDFKDDEINSLDNLCLLSDSVNRGIGNEIFSVKRQMIINYDKEMDKCNAKHFIPIATKQVFSKYYSETVSQMHKWSKADRDAYRKAIIKVITYYGSMEGLV